MFSAFLRETADQTPKFRPILPKTAKSADYLLGEAGQKWGKIFGKFDGEGFSANTVGRRNLPHKAGKYTEILIVDFQPDRFGGLPLRGSW